MGDVTVGGICNPVVKIVGMTSLGVAVSPIFGIVVVMTWLVSRCGGLDVETVLGGTSTSSLNLLLRCRLQIDCDRIHGLLLFPAPVFD